MLPNLTHPLRNEDELEVKELYSTPSTGDIVRCALNNDFDGVDRALAENPKLINARDPYIGITALMAAGGHGLNDMTDHLLAKDGIDVFMLDFSEKSAIEHSVLFPVIVRKIMKKRNPGFRTGEPHPV